MQLLMHEDFTAKLKAAKTPKEFISIIDAKETEKFPDEPKAEVPAKKGYRVLATGEGAVADDGQAFGKLDLGKRSTVLEGAEFYFGRTFGDLYRF